MRCRRFITHHHLSCHRITSYMRNNSFVYCNVCYCCGGAEPIGKHASKSIAAPSPAGWPDGEPRSSRPARCTSPTSDGLPASCRDTAGSLVTSHKRNEHVFTQKNALLVFSCPPFPVRCHFAGSVRVFVVVLVVVGSGVCVPNGEGGGFVLMAIGLISFRLVFLTEAKQ